MTPYKVREDVLCVVSSPIDLDRAKPCIEKWPKALECRQTAGIELDLISDVPDWHETTGRETNDWGRKGDRKTVV